MCDWLLVMLHATLIGYFWYSFGLLSDDLRKVFNIWVVFNIEFTIASLIYFYWIPYHKGVLGLASLFQSPISTLILIND